MTTTTLRHTDQIIAALPYLIGFAPTESLVALTIRDSGEVGPVIRVDLPGPRGRVPMAGHLAEIITGHQVAVALLVVVGGGREPLPHAPFVVAVTEALADVGVRVEHAFWTRAVEAGSQWLSYTSPELSGTVADPDSSAVAAQFTVQGVVVYASREDMADTLAADPEDDLDRRASLIDAIATADGSTTAEKVALVHSVVEQFAIRSPAVRPHPTDRAPTDPDLDDSTLAQLAVALSDPQVREACLSIALGSRDRAAARLWTRLTRALPAPERAEPAVHLAVSTYLRGDGVYARVALALALAANPRHSLAALLDSAAHHGIPPDDLRTLIADARTGPG
ncbi:DUF4192 domain-containing protein [Actinokineospora terrae]|uniref:DUF4192 domain-containing protein n=1 Tax=Actinokineospora terrae TaxID=155974 RepID=A0A1H9XR00_9PSEU|nr:DUF4192 domain-containing protein [Actinokineospora terrae]SES48580.1 protein of unknown function [Actinokineospora terrae]